MSSKDDVLNSAGSERLIKPLSSTTHNMQQAFTYMGACHSPLTVFSVSGHPKRVIQKFYQRILMHPVFSNESVT